MTDHMDEALDLFKRVWNRKDLDTETQIEQVHAALQAAKESGRQSAERSMSALIEDPDKFRVALKSLVNDAYESGRQEAFDQSIKICEHAIEHYKGPVALKILREIRVAAIRKDQP